MSLIRDKGYVATTTKDIARLAGVNECTLFRKFQNKKDIVLHGVSQEKWRAHVTPELFKNVQWELEPDLEMFMNAYMDKITPDFVNLSIGLRAPQLYEETASMIMKVPQAFISSLTENTGFAAGIAISVILLNYYSVTLAEYVSSTSLGSAIAFAGIAAVLGFVVRYVTKHNRLAYGVAVALCLAVLGVYALDRSKFEGLLPDIMTKLSLFERFYKFVNGVFDLTAIIYYITVIVFFLFLSVQSLEKRRYN